MPVRDLRMLAELEVILVGIANAQQAITAEEALSGGFTAHGFVVREVALNGPEIYFRASGVVASPERGLVVSRAIRELAYQLNAHPTVRAKWWLPSQHNRGGDHGQG